MDFLNNEKYMLTTDVIQNAIDKCCYFQKISDKDILKKKPIKNNNDASCTNESNKIVSSKFEPRDKDTLFWCLYAMKHGIEKYHMLERRNFILEKKIKIEYIENLRKEKQLLKTYKFATLAHIEDQLANHVKIDFKTFITLCTLENLNIHFIKSKTCYTHLMNDTSDIFVIFYLDKDRYAFQKIDKSELANFTEPYYVLDNIEKPIKSISSYKVQELIDICNKLGIEIIHSDTKKTKTKQQLYESIVLHL
jgi:hypothetical protein